VAPGSDERKPFTVSAIVASSLKHGIRTAILGCFELANCSPSADGHAYRGDEPEAARPDF
jgi:hypothetical protein